MPIEYRTVLSQAYGFREWLTGYPELFGTPLHHDCFLRIALMTVETDALSPLKDLYRGLPYAENAVRAYVRRLAQDGWIECFEPESGDRRMGGLRITPRFKELRDAYVQAHGRIVAPSPATQPLGASAGLQPRFRA